MGPLTIRLAVPRGLARRMSRAIGQTYPQLGAVEIEYAWHAEADYAVHRMPQIGQLAPGLWLAAAFTHHGIAAAAMAGDLIARAIVDNDDQWRIFQSYGLVWTGGAAGRLAVGAMLRLARWRAAMRQHHVPPPESAEAAGETGAAPPAETDSFASGDVPVPAEAQGATPARKRAKPKAAGPGCKRLRRLRLRPRKRKDRASGEPEAALQEADAAEDSTRAAAQTEAAPVA